LHSLSGHRDEKKGEEDIGRTYMILKLKARGLWGCDVVWLDV
jgi:hypothetical protein